MADDDLTMSSTTDSPEEIRAGLGLPPVEPPAPIDPVAAAQAVLDAAMAEAAAKVEAAKVAETPVVAEPIAAEPVVAKAAEPVVQARKPRPKVERIDELTKEKAAERAARIVAETEASALRTRLAELTAAAVKPAEPVKPAVVAKDRLTEIAEAKAALVEPKEEDFQDFAALRKAERVFDRQLAQLEAEETFERKLAADRRASADLAIRTHADRVAALETSRAAAKAKYADWDVVVTDDVQISPVMREWLLRPDHHDLAGDVTHALGANRDETARIRALDDAARLANRFPTEAIQAMDDLAATVKAKLAAPASSAHAGATQVGAASPAPAKPLTRAPEPATTQLGGSASTVTTDLEAVSSQAEYNRLRNRQEAARRGR